MVPRFRWQIENQLAGMGRPLFRREGNCLAADFLKAAGITAIVSLVEVADEVPPAFIYRHFPIPDGLRPTLPGIREIVETIAKLIAEGQKVAVHCTAGLGRTGTILACYLVHTGLSAYDAIEAVRRREPFAIENIRQEQAVCEYESFLIKTGRRQEK
ncbi:MAG TPA: dual specificity protein phosphatase family protein [Planctomycetota bacterium]|nr:dual specificity protein phosphatase family protein [Planctomycetota bacterium]